MPTSAPTSTSRLLRLRHISLRMRLFFSLSSAHSHSQTVTTEKTTTTDFNTRIHLWPRLSYDVPSDLIRFASEKEQSLSNRTSGGTTKSNEYRTGTWAYPYSRIRTNRRILRNSRIRTRASFSRFVNTNTSICVNTSTEISVFVFVFSNTSLLVRHAPVIRQDRLSRSQSVSHDQIESVAKR